MAARMMTRATNSSRCLPWDNSMASLRYLPRRNGRVQGDGAGGLAGGGLAGGGAGRDAAPGPAEPDPPVARGMGPVDRVPELRAQPAVPPAPDPPEPDPPEPP